MRYERTIAWNTLGVSICAARVPSLLVWRRHYALQLKMRAALIMFNTE